MGMGSVFNNGTRSWKQTCWEVQRTRPAWLDEEVATAPRSTAQTLGWAPGTVSHPAAHTAQQCSPPSGSLSL